MKTDRKVHWEDVYSGKAAHEVSWYQERPDLSLSLIANSGLDPGAAIIDIGAGASLLVDLLLDLDYQDITVLDISPAALAQVSERLAERSSKVALIEVDVMRFVPDRQFELWHDRAAFHFLTKPRDRRRYIEALHLALAPGGSLVIATFAPGGPAKCSGLEIVQYDAARLIGELGEEFILEEQYSEVHITPANSEQLFNFFRLKRTKSTL